MYAEVSSSWRKEAGVGEAEEAGVSRSRMCICRRKFVPRRLQDSHPVNKMGIKIESGCSLAIWPLASSRLAGAKWFRRQPGVLVI